jgi:uncharacterized membrane protein
MREGDTERLVFFSDAVVAIAITLLALDLHVPGGDSNRAFWHDAVAHGNDYLSFLISFAVIGNYWMGHHRVFGYVTEVSGGLMRWNMLWLLTIVATPFATRIIVGDGALAARITVYAVAQALAATFFLLAVSEVDRKGLVRDGTPRAVITDAYRLMSTVAVLFLVSVPLAYLVGRWAYVCWAAIVVVNRTWVLVSDRRSRSRTAPDR